MDLKCPKCHSENTQKVSLAYGAGTNVSRSKTLGFGASSGSDLGLVSASTKSQSASVLASSIQPPKKESVFGLFVGSIILVGIAAYFGGVYWAIGVGALCIFTMISTSKKNKNEIEPAIKAWNESYICLRCENVFIP